MTSLISFIQNVNITFIFSIKRWKISTLVFIRWRFLVSIIHNNAIFYIWSQFKMGIFFSWTFTWRKNWTYFVVAQDFSIYYDNKTDSHDWITSHPRPNTAAPPKQITRLGLVKVIGLNLSLYIYPIHFRNHFYTRQFFKDKNRTSQCTHSKNHNRYRDYTWLSAKHHSKTDFPKLFS